jgi:hypothetical protein
MRERVHLGVSGLLVFVGNKLGISAIQTFYGTTYLQRYSLCLHKESKYNKLSQV